MERCRLSVVVAAIGRLGERLVVLS